eukprot:TRINITY_DN3216_c1_g1_i1.p1 TRINITY_DN3216_c1_g1~~TRINITY_DN3216_c1_g1_i1.p1  ORF type:complete len:75 (+),score=9.54 TRINITY_DN3216_c1_g1_i1:49-273(+)
MSHNYDNYVCSNIFYKGHCSNLFFRFVDIVMVLTDFYSRNSQIESARAICIHQIFFFSSIEESFFTSSMSLLCC